MAVKVPTYDGFQVRNEVVPQAYQDAPNLHPELVGQTAKAMGDGMMQLGGEVGRMAEDMTRETNQLRLDDAAMQLRERARQLQYGQQTQSGQTDPGQPVGYAQLQGRDALDRPNGQSLAEEYGAKLQAHIGDISESLGNDAQRQAFTKYADGFLGGFQDNVWQHAFTQQRNYAMSVADGLKGEAVEDLKTNYRNPVAAQAAIETIKEQANRLGKLRGQSVAEIDVNTKKEVSQALQSGVNAFLADGDPSGAQQFFKRFSAHMTMDDALPATQLINKTVDQHVGLSGGQSAFNQALPPGPAQVAFNSMAGVKEMFDKGIISNETGDRGHFNKDGTPIQNTNSNGTKDWGIAQVNEGTAKEAAKLAGLPWDEFKYKNDPQYNYTSGLAYFQEQFRVHGDITKAVASYNAPKATRVAVKEAAKPGNEGKTWFDFLPENVQKYTNAAVDHFNQAMNKPPREMTMADIEAKLAGQNLTPEQLKIARSEGKYQVDNYNAQIKTQGEQAVAAAIQYMDQNKVTFNQLPPQVRNAVPTYKMGEAIAAGKNLTSNETNMALYNHLTMNPLLDPKTNKPMTDDAFLALRAQLSDSDFKHFSDERAKRLGNQAGSNGPGDLNSAAIKTALDNSLSQLGIDPSPKSDGKDAAARVGAIRKFVDQYFIDAQTEAGKKFTDAEVQTHLNTLFARSETFQGFFKNYKGPMMGIDEGDIPSLEKNQIKADFKKQGVDDPTDAQILNAYWMKKVKNQ